MERKSLQFLLRLRSFAFHNTNCSALQPAFYSMDFKSKPNLYQDPFLGTKCKKSISQFIRNISEYSAISRFVICNSLCSVSH